MQKMDKYEFNIKVEQIKKLVNKGDYETAMKIADTIDWRRVRSASLLTMVAQIYERNEEYEDAKDILLLAFERAPISKRLLYKLTDLALKEGKVDEAEAYYREFCDLAADDPRQQLLRYMILAAKDAPLEQQIHSLESYCNEELDEKWLYRLAELYHAAGNQSECVRICDKIMLLFGLGKYVDKAMELKQEFAPLTDYQMDLVENRDKYEQKLRRVEQEFGSAPAGKAPQEEYYDEESAETAVPEELAELHEAAAEEKLAEEMSRISVEEYTEEENPAEETRVIGDIRRLRSRAGEAAGTQAEEPADVEVKAAADEAAAELAGPETAAAVAAETESAHETEERFAQTRVMPADGVSETAAAEEETPAAEAAQRAMRESAAAVRETAVITEDDDMELEDWDDDGAPAIEHLIIETEDMEAGLDRALEELREIYRKTGVKNPVAKISGDKLNQRGILASARKLAGKNLIVERAADLNLAMLDELETLMEGDTTGIRVILIDTPASINYIQTKHPAMYRKFRTITCHAKRQSQVDVEDAIFRELSAKKAVEKQTAAQEAVARAAVQEEKKARREEPAEAKPVREARDERRRSEVEMDREADRIMAEKMAAAERAAAEKPDDEKVMDVEEFAQYACKYASEIDCSITGKSLLALYERIEMMDEDGVELTKRVAEDLIEEAADKAEKPSFFGAIRGIFSPKYDKDGLLILKEKNFFD